MSVAYLVSALVAYIALAALLGKWFKHRDGH
jgi:hypothetical protein